MNSSGTTTPPSDSRDTRCKPCSKRLCWPTTMHSARTRTSLACERRLRAPPLSDRKSRTAAGRSIV
eukprot:4677436-Alexandrium_andersonii.AAC.1